MNAPKSIVAIMREVALELRQRARSMGRGELPRFLYREAAKLIEAMEANHDEARSGDVDVGDRRPANTGDAGAGDRCTCGRRGEAEHARGCEEWAPSPEEVARLKGGAKINYEEAARPFCAECEALDTLCSYHEALDEPESEEG